MKKMNGFQHLLALMICVMLAFVIATGFVLESKAEDLQATVDGYTYTYTVSNGKATITKVDPKPTGDYTIPDKLNDYPVTVIGEKVFQECKKLEDLIIPNGVTDIGSYAFDQCTCLSEVTMPNSVRSIGDYAFQNAFTGHFTIPDGVQSIGKYAFNEASIMDLKIPDSVTDIGEGAFRAVCFSSVTIGSGVRKIGQGAFKYNEHVEEVRCGNLAAWCAIEFEDEMSNPLAPAVNAGGRSTVDFYINEDKLEHLVIPAGVKSIGDYAFSGCNLTTVMIPPGVETIGQAAFYRCTMVSATISEDVTSIGDNAFDSCSNLKTLYYIGNEDALKKVNVGANLPGIIFAPRVTVTVCPDYSGTVTGGGTGLINRTATVSATPAEHYIFVCWKDADGNVIKDENGNDAGAEYSFTVTGNTKLTAFFKSDKPPVWGMNSIEGAKVKVSNQVYTGKKLKPALKVTLGEKTLELNTDYTVKWKNNREIGKATVILTGIGEYSGTVKKSFKINPQPVKAIKLEDKQGKLFAEWKIKKGSDIDGYELEYWTKKDKSDKQESEITSKSIRKLEIKKIKPGKPCYVRIRTYKLIKENKYYSEWSETVNQTNL